MSYLIFFFHDTSHSLNKIAYLHFTLRSSILDKIRTLEHFYLKRLHKYISDFNIHVKIV